MPAATRFDRAAIRLVFTRPATFFRCMNLPGHLLWHAPKTNPAALAAGSWGASVARCPPDRADLRYLRSESSRSHTIVVGISKIGPVSVVPCRAKTIPLLRASSLVRPHKACRQKLVFSWSNRQVWWRRRVLPPGPLRLFRTAFIAIVGHADMLNISIQRLNLKQQSGLPLVT